MTVMANAVPGAGQVMEGAAGPAGGAGPNPAGGFHDAVADASNPFGQAWQDSAPGPARTAAAPWREQLAMLLAGLAVITGLSLVRSRRRRRRGWGMLPVRRAADQGLWQ